VEKDLVSTFRQRRADEFAFFVLLALAALAGVDQIPVIPEQKIIRIFACY
jgi:hypothetical protein